MVLGLEVPLPLPGNLRLLCFFLIFSLRRWFRLMRRAASSASC